jgi:hypothetical protein
MPRLYALVTEVTKLGRDGAGAEGRATFSVHETCAATFLPTPKHGSADGTTILPSTKHRLSPFWLHLSVHDCLPTHPAATAGARSRAHLPFVSPEVQFPPGVPYSAKITLLIVCEGRQFKLRS